MFKNYFTVAFRNLSRNKIYSFINIAGLSLGLACSMLIILYVKDEVSYDKFHANVNNIYRVVNQYVGVEGILHKNGNTGYFPGPKFTANVPGIKSFVRVQSGYAEIKKGTDVVSQELLRVDSTFFSVFSFPLLSGNPKTCLNQPNTAVLSEEAAKKQFGTVNAVGKVMMFKKDSAFVPFSVTAVAKKCPQNSSIKFDVLLPLIVSATEQENSENWFSFYDLNTFVVLEPNAKMHSVETQMQKFYAADSKEALKTIIAKWGPSDWGGQYFLQPYTAMHLDKDWPRQYGLTGASNPVYSYILSGIALFILFIACINFVNLTIARSIKRAKEIGIRKVVGGERKQLIFQFLSESFFLCFIAFVFALIMVWAILPVFNDLSNKALAIFYLFDMKLVGGYIVLFIITGLLAGFYPALILSSYNPVKTLYSRFMIGGKNYLQKSLVVLQFSLASFLIIATFTIYEQFNYLTTEKLEYDDSNLVIMHKQSMKRAEASLLKDELMKNPNILGVAPKNGWQWGTSAKVNGDSIILFDYETISETYLPTLKIPLVQGRNFSTEFPSDSSQSVIVNESFVKKAGWKNPIGQEVNFWYYNNEKYKVIGVVKDYHFQSLTQKIGPQLFTMKAGNDYGMALIKIKPNTETASLKHIEATFKKLFPLNPYSFTFKDQENVKEYEAEAKWKQIMLFSAVLTIFISCIGLLGLSVLSAEKRTKEIGIRKVLGASVNNVVITLSKDFIKLVIIALLIAVPLSFWAASEWLQNYPYRISLSWQLFVLAGVLVIFIALFTVSFQAIKAAIANPVKSLRTE